MKQENRNGVLHVEPEKKVCCLSRKPGTYGMLKFKPLHNGQGYIETNSYDTYEAILKLVRRSPKRFFNIIKADIKKQEYYESKFSRVEWNNLRNLARLSEMPDSHKSTRNQIEKWLVKHPDEYEKGLERYKEEYGDNNI